MKKSLWLIGMFAFALMAFPTSAVFVQCPGGLPIFCDGDDGVTDGNDVINGTTIVDRIGGLQGDDVIFGGGDTDALEGNEGSDMLFGGSYSDILEGDQGEDNLLPGPDTLEFSQTVSDTEGNDNVYVFAGEISSCLFIALGPGVDVVNLIGFGPYVAIQPFGIAPVFADGWIEVIDPIAGGRIFIQVFENVDTGVEFVNGLNNPNVTFWTETDFQNQIVNTECPPTPPIVA